MPLTSVTKDTATLTLTVVGDYPVPQQRLWDAFADPRQLERFWGPPFAPATFTHHEMKVGGRAEYFLTLPDGGKKDLQRSRKNTASRSVPTGYVKSCRRIPPGETES